MIKIVKFYLTFQLLSLKINLEKNKKKISKYSLAIYSTYKLHINKKSFFLEISNQLDFTNYSDLWLDFRLGIFSKYKLKNIEYFNENLTVYRQTDTNISSKFKYYSINWWKRRMQAHDYLKSFLLTNNFKFTKNFDYYITKLINTFLK